MTDEDVTWQCRNRACAKSFDLALDSQEKDEEFTAGGGIIEEKCPHCEVDFVIGKCKWCGKVEAIHDVDSAGKPYSCAACGFENRINQRLSQVESRYDTLSKALHVKLDEASQSVGQVHVLLQRVSRDLLKLQETTLLALPTKIASQFDAALKEIPILSDSLPGTGDNAWTRIGEYVAKKAARASQSLLEAFQKELSQKLDRLSSIEERLRRIEGSPFLAANSSDQESLRDNAMWSQIGELIAEMVAREISSSQGTISTRLADLKDRVIRIKELPILSAALPDENPLDLPVDNPWYRIANLTANLTRNLTSESLSSKFHLLRQGILGGGTKSKDGRTTWKWHSIPEGMKKDLQTLKDELVAELRETPEKATRRMGIFSRSSQPATDDRREVLELLSFDLPGFKEIVAQFSTKPILKLLSDLPDVFNKVELELRHRQSELARSEPPTDESARAMVELMQELSDDMRNWQRRNHVYQVPESNGEGERVDHRLHFLAGTELTDDPEKHMAIQKVQCYGYVFRDKDAEFIEQGEMVLQKAQVIAWEYPGAP